MGKTRDLFKKIRDTHVRDLNLSHCNDYLLRDFPRSPVVKTLPSNEGAACSSPVWGAKIPHDLEPKNQNIKQKQYCKQFSKDFKNDWHQKRIFAKLQIHIYFLSPY